MPDREKVIALLERYVDIPNLAGVENYGAKIVDMPAPLIADTLALLKAQEARVMTLEEVKYSGMPIWLEWNYHFMKPALLHTDQVMTEDCRNAITFVLFGDEEWYTYADDDYGKEIRCWTSRPDEKRRAETPWN